MIHVVTNGKISFFFMAKQNPFVCVCVYTYTYIYISHFYTCPSVDGHFHILAIVDNAAMNIGVHVSFPISVSFFFSDRYPSSGISESYCSFILRHLHNVFLNGFTSLLHTNTVLKFSFLHILTSCSF